MCFSSGTNFINLASFAQLLRRIHLTLLCTEHKYCFCISVFPSSHHLPTFLPLSRTVLCADPIPSQVTMPASRICVRCLCWGQVALTWLSARNFSDYRVLMLQVSLFIITFCASLVLEHYIVLFQIVLGEKKQNKLWFCYTDSSLFTNIN